ncbi:MAG: arginine--tRNA ligase [Buchnera aphidicola (Nurudea yanoniella)]
MNIKLILKKHTSQALISLGIKNIKYIVINNTGQKKPWNYQIDGLIKIAKELNINSFNLANKVSSKIRIHNMYKKVLVSQPGFISIFLNMLWVEKKLEKKIKSARLDVNYVKKKNIIIDYSSPNVAKEMHVGHLRSTILGDATARIMEFLGHNVIRANHIGDWGMQFGMIIAYLKQYKANPETFKNYNEIYQKAKIKYDNDKLFSNKVKLYTKKLQSEDKSCMKIWKKIVNTTIKKNGKIYKNLNVTLTNKNIMGESFYRKMLFNIVNDLKEKKIAVEYHGSIIVFLNNFKNRDGNPMGVIIQKKDGGFLYSTIDLACLKYRCETLHADKIIYYTDIRQNKHFMQIIEIGKKAGYIPNYLKIEHHMFGMILSEDNHPFKTRSGNNIKLSSLLEKAIKKAKTIIATKKNTKISQKRLDFLAKRIGIGAIKYFDLSKNRTTNYVFNWNKILSFSGNTAPYMQYAYTRILSIFRKLNVSMINLQGKIQLKNKFENQLGIKLLEFEEIITDTANKGMPHILCLYLYQLSTLFSQFYEKCSILFSKNTEIRCSRLILAFLTARTLKKGLNIIGISTINYM